MTYRVKLFSGFSGGTCADRDTFATQSFRSFKRIEPIMGSLAAADGNDLPQISTEIQMGAEAIAASPYGYRSYLILNWIGSDRFEIESSGGAGSGLARFSIAIASSSSSEEPDPFMTRALVTRP